jgi:mycothiol system anti-sigma-R factor
MADVMTCRAAVEQLWAYLDDELVDHDHEAVEAHLAICRRCCGELEFAKHLRRLLMAKGTGELAPGVRARLDNFICELTHATGGDGKA